MHATIFCTNQDQSMALEKERTAPLAYAPYDCIYCHYYNDPRNTFWLAFYENNCIKCQNATLSTGSADTNEPPRGKTNNVVSEQVRHKPACKSTTKSWKLEISDLKGKCTIHVAKTKALISFAVYTIVGFPMGRLRSLE